MTPRILPFSAFWALHLGALILLASWLIPVTGVWWDWLDVRAAFALNNTLRDSPFWQAFWAIANHKMTDVLIALMLLGLTLAWFLREPRERTQALLFLLATFIVGDLACKVLASKALNLLSFYRMSPSMVLSPLFSLPDATPWIYVKAKSTTSFPGDHCCVFLLWALLFGHLARGGWAASAFLIASIGALPRLFSSTHWPTDILVGSLSLLMVTLAWTLASPLGTLLLKKATWVSRRYGH